MTTCACPHELLSLPFHLPASPLGCFPCPSSHFLRLSWVCNLLSSVHHAALPALHRRLMSHEEERAQGEPALRRNRNRSLHWAIRLVASRLPLPLWWRRTCTGSQPISELPEPESNYWIHQHPLPSPWDLLSLFPGPCHIYESLLYPFLTPFPNHFSLSIDSRC